MAQIPLLHAPCSRGGVARDLGARGDWLFGGPLDFDIRDRDMGKHFLFFGGTLFGGPPKVGARGDL